MPKPFTVTSVKKAGRSTNKDRIQGEIGRSGDSIHSKPASLPRKQQMTQKKEMKTQDIEIPRMLGCRMAL